MKMLERQRAREEKLKIKNEAIKKKEIQRQKIREEKEKERQEQNNLKEIERQKLDEEQKIEAARKLKYEEEKLTENRLKQLKMIDNKKPRNNF